jgi:hypothetical protein
LTLARTTFAEHGSGMRPDVSEPTGEQLAEYLLDINRLSEEEVRAKWDIDVMDPALAEAFDSMEAYGLIERVPA